VVDLPTTNFDGVPLPTMFDISYTDGSGGPGVNPYSAIGLTGKLQPIAMASGNDKIARTVNGKAIDISAPQMRKYRLEISGSAMSPPAIEGLFAGVLVNVNSNVEIALANGQVASRSAGPYGVRTEGGYTYLAYAFQMIVIDADIQRDEWTQMVSWHIILEEV
jgi:hypothetical protein